MNDSSGCAWASGVERCVAAVVMLISWAFACLAFRALLRRRDSIFYNELSAPVDSVSSSHEGSGGSSKIIISDDRDRSSSSGYSSVPPSSSPIAATLGRPLLHEPHPLSSSINSERDLVIRPRRVSIASTSNGRWQGTMNPYWRRGLMCDHHARFFLACAIVGLVMAPFQALLVVSAQWATEGEVPTFVILIGVYAALFASAQLLMIISLVSDVPAATRGLVFTVFLVVWVAMFGCSCVCAALLDSRSWTNRAIDVMSAFLCSVICCGCVWTIFAVPAAPRLLRASLLLLSVGFGAKAILDLPIVQVHLEVPLGSLLFVCLWCLELVGPLFAALACLHHMR